VNWRKRLQACCPRYNYLRDPYRSLWLMSRSQNPIVIGPWRSELGFEVLYWLPWLKWAREVFKLDKRRTIVLSRGGAGVWYDAERTIDLYNLATLEELRHAARHDTDMHRSVKQTEATVFDRDLLTRAKLPLQSLCWLHPSLMYRHMRRFWEDRSGFAWAAPFLRFSPMPESPMPAGLILPKDYAAVRFYWRATFPPQVVVAEWVQKLVKRMLAKGPVVSLTPGGQYDDHADCPIDDHLNLIRIEPHVTPVTNLSVQAEVLRKAKLFVGTYGGTAQLALRMGVPTVSYYATPWTGTHEAHRELSIRFSHATGVPFQVCHANELALLGRLV